LFVAIFGILNTTASNQHHHGHNYLYLILFI